LDYPLFNLKVVRKAKRKHKFVPKLIQTEYTTLSIDNWTTNMKGDE
jgi:hypothetical protein